MHLLIPPNQRRIGHTRRRAEFSPHARLKRKVALHLIFSIPEVTIKMSGIELALAIAPLILGTVKVYQKTWEFTKSASRPAVVRDSQIEFCRNVHYEVAILTLVLERLISELPALDVEEKDSLLAHDRDLWRSPKVSTALEQRLRGEHEAFTETLEVMLDAFERIIRDKSLPLNDMNAVWIPYESQ